MVTTGEKGHHNGAGSRYKMVIDKIVTGEPAHSIQHDMHNQLTASHIVTIHLSKYGQVVVNVDLKQGVNEDW